MEKYISKSALVAEINKLTRENELYLDENTSDAVRFQKTGAYIVLCDLLHFIDTLEVKEVDLELITGWFDHIAQIADDRMTLTNQKMTDAYALDEIKCLAKNSSEFITKHYKA